MAETRFEQQLRADGGGGRTVTSRLGWVLAALALALVLVAFVGLGSGRPLWDIGGTPTLVDPGAYAGDLVVGFALLAVTPFVVRALRRRRRRVVAEPDDPEVAPVPLPWWGRVLTLVAVVGVVLLSLQLLRVLPRSGSSGDDGSEARVDEATTPAAATSDRDFLPVHWYGLAALAVVLLAGMALAWRLREAPIEPADPEPDEADELLAAVDLSLEDLEAEPDPRRAVIRAYARMEGALAAHGLARRPAETPLEYLARSLTSLRIGRASVERLSALFERAKFSQHEIDPSMKTDALEALAALRAELAAGRA